MWVSLNRTIDAASEPLTLEDAKEHLRVLTSDDDDYITALISAARNHVETATGRALINQTWVATFDNFCGLKLFLPRPPLVSVVGVTYRDTSDGTAQTVSSNDYEVNSLSEPGLIRFETLPSFDSTLENPIAVEFVAGFGEAPINVPRELLHAMKLLIGHWYRQRSSVANAEEFDPRKMPMAFECLCAPHRFFHHKNSNH